MASIKELLSAMIAKINGKNEGVDWNENDETSPAFVKNRPFYQNELLSVTLEGTPFVWYKVSSDIPANVPSIDTFIYIWLNNKVGKTGILYSSDSVYVGTEFLFIVALTDNVQFDFGGKTIYLPERGTYFLKAGDTLVTGIHTKTYVTGANPPDPEISWDGNTGVIKQIDEKFIPEMSNVILKSSTADSTKKYKITVDDSGAITSTDTSDSSISYTPYSPPAVTEADAGKFLRVSSTGEWVAEKPTYTASDVGAAAESHDHNLQDLSGTVPLSKGGTGATNASDALANLGAFRFLGNNVIASTDDDTTSNWVALGSGYAFFSDDGVLTDQPSHWGIVVSFVTGSDIFQMWRVQTGGPTYWRGGNASGWSGTWVKVYDTANKPAFGDLDGQPTPTLSNTNVEIVQRTQYTYIGNMLVMSGITPEVECANNAVTSYNVWFPKTFSSACVVMSSLYYNNDDPSLSNKVSAVAGWYRNDTVVIKFANTSGATRKLRASWLAIGM